MKLLKCKYADKYQAIYPPRCGCQFCNDKWESIGRAKARLEQRRNKSSVKRT